MALSSNEKEVEGYIYSLHTKSNRYTVFQSQWDRIDKLGRTENVNLVTVRDFGGTDWINSVGPMC